MGDRGGSSPFTRIEKEFMEIHGLFLFCYVAAPQEPKSGVEFAKYGKVRYNN